MESRWILVWQLLVLSTTEYEKNSAMGTVAHLILFWHTYLPELRETERDG